MHSLNYKWEINKFWLRCAGVLLASGNWNNGAKAGVSYRNSNNSPANVNANIGRHVELKTRLGGPEQQPNLNQSNLVKQKAIHPGVLVHNGRFSWNGRADI